MLDDFRRSKVTYSPTGEIHVRMYRNFKFMGRYEIFFDGLHWYYRFQPPVIHGHVSELATSKEEVKYPLLS